MIARALRLLAALLVLVAVTVSAQQVPAAKSTPGSPRPDAEATAARAAEIARMPLSFEPNQGQTDARVKFLSRGPGYALFVQATEAVFALAPGSKNGIGSAVGIAVELSGANTKAVGEAIDPLPGKSNYYLGNDPKKWQSNIPTFSKVRYRGIYPGTDLVYYGNQQRLEYDFVLAPGSDPNRIELRFRGAEKVAISAEGELVLTAGGREVRMRKPEIYQRHGEETTTISGSYQMRGADQVGFRVGAYDLGRELVIDPQLVFSTFLGGSYYDYGYAVATDSSDNGYLAGAACSSNFPIVGVGPQTVHCYDAFVAKFSGTAPATLLYSTVIGGTRGENGYGIAVDGSGNAYLTGNTNSWDFPVKSWPGNQTLAGENDGYLAKFGPGGALLYSGYFGGSAHDEPRSIAVDGNGNIDVAGFTTSLNLPSARGSAGSGGVFASTNSGQNWSLNTGGMSGPNIQALAVSIDGTHVYAGGDGGFYYSDSTAGSWTKSNGWIIPAAGNPSTVVQSILATSIPAPCGSNGNCVYIGTENSVFGSTDYGATWQYVPSSSSQPNAMVRSLTMDPQGNLYAGTDNGAWKLASGGPAWTKLGTLTGTVWSIVADPTTSTNPPILYAAAGNNLGQYAVWKSSDGGNSWNTTAAPQSTTTYTYLAHDPATSGVVYAIAGTNIYATNTGGNFWANSGFSVNGVPAHAIAIDPVNRSKLYVASDGAVYTSTAGTDSTSTSWTSAHTGLTTFADYAIAVNPSPTYSGYVYVGTLYRDAFVTQFNSSGAVQWTYYLGGSEDDQAWGVAVDGSNNVHVAGETYSPNFPSTVSGSSWQAPSADAFVTILNSSGTLLASRFLGGNGYDIARAIAADSSGNSYVTGTTYSNNFPVQSVACTPSPCPVIQQTSGGNTDAFVTKLDNGLNLVYSTYLGGSSWEDGNAIAVESPTGKVFVAGKTWSNNFPLANPYQPFLQTGPDAFLAKLDQTGSALIFSTLLGGDQWDEAFGVAEGPTGNVFVGGQTSSGNFPTFAALNSGAKPNAVGQASAWLTKFAAVTNDSDVSVALTGATSATSGTGFNYTVTVTNNTSVNPAGAQNVAVTLQVNGPWHDWGTATGATCYTNYLANALHCDLGTVASSAQITIPVTPRSSGTLTATAYVSTTGSDINAGNNTSPAFNTTVNSGVQLSVSMSHTPEPVVHGTQVTENIVFTSLYDPPNTTSFTFNMPTGSVYVGASNSVSCSAFSPPQVNCTLNNNFGSPGQSVTASITYIAPAVNGTYTGNAGTGAGPSVTSIIATKPGATIYTTTGSMIDILTVSAGANLSTTISGAPATMLPGQQATLTIGVTNNGPDNTTNATMWMAMAAGMFVSSNPACTYTPIADQSYGTVFCNVGNLAYGQTANIFLTLQSPSGFAGYLTLNAKVSSDLNMAIQWGGGSVTIEFKPSATATERVLVADRSSAVVRNFSLDLSGEGTEFPNYSGSGAMLMSPNGRVLLDGRSVVDTTLNLEVARVRTYGNAAPTLADGGRRALYVGGNKIDIVSMHDFSTINTVGLAISDLVGPNDPSVMTLVGGAMAGPGGNVAYVNPAGTSPVNGGGFPVATVDLSTCWDTPGACTPQIATVNGTNVGFGVNNPQSMARFYSKNGVMVLALRRAGTGGSLLIIDPSTTPQTVTPVTLSFVPSAVVVTKNPNRVYAYVVGGRRIAVVDINPDHTTFGQVLQNLSLTYGAGSAFSANHLDISGDGNTLYLMSTNAAANQNTNLGALSVQSLLAGSIVWVKQPFQAGTTGSNSGMRAVMTGYVDQAAPANAPVITDTEPTVAFNDNPVSFVVNGTGFSTDARVKVGWLNPIPADPSSTSTQLMVTLPKGTPAQQGPIVVTNGNGSNPVNQQAVSAAWYGGPNQSEPTIVSSQSYQPQHPLVVLNYYTNNIAVNENSPLRFKPMWQTGSSNANYPGALSWDGSRLYLINNAGAIYSYNLDTGAPDPDGGFALQPINDASTYQVFLGMSASVFDRKLYVAAASINWGVTDNSVLQLLAVDTDPLSPTFNTFKYTISSPTLPGTDAYPDNVTVSPDGQYAYAIYDTWDAATGVNETDYLVVFNLSNHTASAPIPLDTVGGYVYGPLSAPDNATLVMGGASAPGMADGTLKVVELGADRQTPGLKATITAARPSQYPALQTPSLDSFVVIGNALFAADSTQNLLLGFSYDIATPNFAQIPSAAYVVPSQSSSTIGLSNGFALAASADSGYLYIANFWDNTVAVLNPGLLLIGNDPFVTALASGDAPSQMWISPRSTPSVDLAMTMTGPSAAAPSQQITYPITVTNTSSTQATTGMYLIDHLPVGAGFVSAAGCVFDASGVQQGCGSGSYNPYSNTVEAGNIQLGPNGHMTIQLVITAPSTTGQITNLVQIGADQSDSNPANNIAMVTTDLVPGLVITTNTLPPARFNGTYSATLAATNGTTPYTWSMLTGTLPPGLGLNSSTGAITGTATTSGTYTFTVQVMDATTNTASATLSITVGTFAGVSFAMSHTPEPVLRGGNFTETITVTNLYDPISSASFEFGYNVPGNYVSVSSNCTIAANNPVSCTSGALGNGQSETFTIVYGTSSAAASGAYPFAVDKISVTPQTTGALGQAPQGTLSDIVNVVSGADLSVSISPSGKQTDVLGQNTNTFTIQVYNNGTDTPHSVVINAKPGATANIVSFAPTNICSVVTASNSVTCNVGTLAPGNSASMTISLQPTQPGYFTVLGQASSEFPDPNTTNNTASVRVEVLPTATSVERWLVTDRFNAIFHTFPLGSGTEVSGSGNGGLPLFSGTSYLPYYGSVGSIFLAPNARTLVNGRSVVDTTLGVEVARTHVTNTAAVAAKADGTRLVYAEGNDTIEIVDTATFDTVNTISLNGLLGDSSSLNTDSNIQGIAIVGNTAYISPAGTLPGGGGFPIFTVDLTNCWNKGTTCAPTPVAVAGTAVGYGAKGPQTMATGSSQNGSPFVVALRSSPDTLLVIDTSVTPQTVKSVALPYAPSGMAVTKDPRDPKGVYAYMVAGTEIMVMDIKFGTGLFTPLVMTCPAQTCTGNFNAGRVAVSGDGNQLYVINTTIQGNGGFTAGALDTAALRSGSISWVMGPVKVPAVSDGALTAILTGYVDTATPANAPVITSYTPLAAINDAPINVTINGTGFSPDARVRWAWLDPIVPTSVTSSQITFTLPAGTPAQTGDLIVTNTNATSPVVGQVVSTWARNLNNQENPHVQPPASYQPAHPLVFYNSLNNAISVAGRVPFGLPADDAGGYCNNPGCVNGQFGYHSGTSNFGSYAGLSLDGARLYMHKFSNTLFALNLDTGNIEPSLYLAANTNYGALAPGLNPSNSAPLMYVSATTNISGSPGTTQFQLGGIDTNPANTGTLNHLVFPSTSGLISSAGTTGTSNADGLAVTPNGQYAYATYDLHNGTTETDYLVVYNLVNQSIPNQIPLQTLCAGDVKAPVYVTPDGNYLLLLSNGTGTSCPAAGTIVVLSLANPTFPTWVANIAATPPQGLTAPYLDSYVVSGNHLFASDYRQSLVVAFNFNPGASDFSQLSTYVVPSLPAGPSGLGSYRGLAISDDGKLYVDNYQGNSIVVLDAAQFAANATNPVLNSFSAGIGPLGMWVSPRTTASDDVSVSMTGPATAAPGQQVTYTVHLGTTAMSNGNPNGDQVGAYEIIHLPAGSALVSWSACFYHPDGTLESSGCDTGMTWPTANNTATAGGLYLRPGGWADMTWLVTVPSTLGPATVSIQVGSDQNDANQLNNSASVTTNVTTGLVITTQSPLPDATVDTAYSQQMAATSGIGTYTWSMATGTLPPGVSLSSAGVLSGIPTSAGTYTFTVQVADSASPTPQTAQATLSITVVRQQADLAVTAHPNPVFTASTTTYSVDVSNLVGPASASNVVLTDSLTRYTFVSASYSGPGGSGPCSASSGVVRCSMGSLPYPGQATVTVTVGNPTSGWASNLFHATADQLDPNPVNNSVQIGPVVEGANTAVGANVAAFATDSTTGTSVAVTFSNVTAPGNTTLAATGTGPAPPATYRAGTPLVFYDLHTTATWSGGATVNLSYAGVTFHHPDKVHLFHQENGVWVDRTVSVDGTHHVVTAVVPSFSLFALFEPVNHAPIAGAKAAVAPGVSAGGASLKLDATPSSDVDGDSLTYRWSGPFPEGAGAVTGATPTVTLPLGASNVTLVVNDGETDSAPVTVPVVVSDFAITLPVASVTATRGQSVSLTVNITPKYGSFDGPIALACPNLPAGSTCAFSSATVTPGAQAVTATLTLTIGNTTASALPAHRGLYALWLGMLPFGLLLSGGVRRKRAWWLLLAILLLLVASQFGCGGGGSNAPATTQTTTPASTVTVTVSGTSGSLTHSSTATVAVH